jgi:subtilisin family serine protease
MPGMKFYSGGKLVTLQVQPLAQIAGTAPAVKRAARGATTGASRGAALAPRPASSPATAVPRAMSLVHAQAQRMAPLFHSLNEGQTLAAVNPGGSGGTVLVTETLVLDKANQALLKHLRDKFGMQLLREGRHGKLLLKAPEGGASGVAQVMAASREAYERGNGRGAAHPNFVRLLDQLDAAPSAQAKHWNLLNKGQPGKRGADVAARAAWTISEGVAAVRVAILDEGVDTLHPALKPAVVAERDFVEGRPHARPDGDDAHGTTCAGIVLSRSKTYPGLAPRCSLVAARIAKGDGQGGWVFDDFNTADAIDWCWDEAQAAVLSNSWGGGPPVDAIINAFERARRQGRGGKGSVVVCATGNENGPIGFPATLAEVLSVGASTPWDERKSPSTADGENWWGSNHGNSIDLLAPGVWIACTDIRGQRGYGSGAYTGTFNGTSAATPHVAAAAALVLSVAPQLGEAAVRKIITDSCDKITPSGAWDRHVGHGRLNLHAALRLALR